LYNGTGYDEPVTQPAELCGGCHEGSRHPQYDHWNTSAHANTYHNGTGHDNDNAYCARCVSPFQYDPDAERETAALVSEENWTAITCTVCHNPHSLELQLFNGTGYEDPIDDPSDLCLACHSGSRHDTGWAESAHAYNWHNGTDHDNDNAYCARCVSPFNYFEDAERTDMVLEEDWLGIGCTVCHDQHSLELSLWNGTGREDPTHQPAELCGGCHGTSSRHTEYEDWADSAHANSYHSGGDHDNDNSYCARCVSPFQYDPETNRSTSYLIPEENWTAITCTVCHDPHSLELKLFNGTEYSEEEFTKASDLCGECHGGSDHHHIWDDWNETGHANSWSAHAGNTYCARCVSPLDFEPLFNETTNTSRTNSHNITEDNWTGISCVVCHHPHSLELVTYDGEEYEEVATVDELCGNCHTMGDAELGDSPHHPQLEIRGGYGGIGVDNISYKPDTSCSDCHMLGGDHSLNLTTINLACADCHSSKTNESAWDEINATADAYDILFDACEANIDEMETLKEAAELAGTWEAADDETFDRAVFNFHLADDGSHGNHNPEYTEALLAFATADAQEIIDKYGDVTVTTTVSPTDGATDVALDAVVTVQFSEAIDFTALQADGLLSVEGVTGTLTYNDTTNTVTFTPDAAFAYETTYTATLSKDVATAGGMMFLADNLTWSFTTISEPEPDVYDITVGPVLDEDGDPLEGVEIKVTVDGVEYTATTDENGYATFEDMPWDSFPPGTKFKGTKDDYEDIEWTEGDSIPKMEATGSNLWIIIVVILVILLIIIIIVAVFFMMKKKEEPEEEEEEDEEEEEQEVECPECGAMAPAGETECPECGEELPEIEEEEEEEEEEELVCPECGAEVEADDTECPECGEELPEIEEEEEDEEELDEGEEEEDEEYDEEEEIEEGEEEEELEEGEEEEDLEEEEGEEDLDLEEEGEAELEEEEGEEDLDLEEEVEAEAEEELDDDLEEMDSGLEELEKEDDELAA
jgi:predicted amidophosphoribosyltransferase